MNPRRELVPRERALVIVRGRAHIPKRIDLARIWRAVHIILPTLEILNSATHWSEHVDIRRRLANVLKFDPTGEDIAAVELRVYGGFDRLQSVFQKQTRVRYNSAALKLFLARVKIDVFPIPRK